MQAEQTASQLQADLAQAREELVQLRAQLRRREDSGCDRQLESLRAFAANVYAARGDAFFSLLTQTLSEALKLDFVCISQRCPTGAPKARTLAFVSHGQVVENIGYGLIGTPCEQVLEGKVCAYPEDVQDLFPDDRDLVTFGVHAYVGVPLIDEAGNTIGLISTMHSGPIEDVPHVVSFLQLVARPVTAEMDRRRAEESLAHHAKELECAYARLHERNVVNELEIEVRTRELAQEKAQSEVMIAHLPVAMIFLDADLVIRWASPVVFPLLGLSPEAFLHRPLGDFSPDEVGVDSHTYAAFMSKQPQQVRAVPLPFSMDQPGSGYWDVSYIPALDADGIVIGLMIMGNEVTSQVENQQLQAERIEQLEELDRLKRDFVNTVSHELRTPLTSIMGFAEFLEDHVGGQLTPLQCDYVQHILAGARRLRRIVDDLLDFSRLEAGTLALTREPVEVVDLLCQAMDSLFPQAAEAGVALEADWPDAEVALSLDGRRVGQVLLNLVSNAIKFTPAGGRVQVTTRVEQGGVHVDVRDTGIGISAEHLPQLFEKFYQVDPSTTRVHGGAGLGLAIAKAFVEAHGGEIGVQSTPDVGSTFWFRLPAPIG